MVVARSIAYPTLSYLVTAHDTRYTIQLAPPSSDVRSERDADSLVPESRQSATLSVSGPTYTFTRSPSRGFLRVRPKELWYCSAFNLQP